MPSEGYSSGYYCLQQILISLILNRDTYAQMYGCTVCNYWAMNFANKHVQLSHLLVLIMSVIVSLSWLFHKIAFYYKYINIINIEYFLINIIIYFKC